MKDRMMYDLYDLDALPPEEGIVEIPLSDLDEHDLDLVRADFGLGAGMFEEENDDEDWLVHNLERWADR